MFEIENCFHKALAPYLFQISTSSLSIIDDFSQIYFLLSYGRKFNKKEYIEKGQFLLKINYARIGQLNKVEEINKFGLKSEYTSFVFLLKLIYGLNQMPTHYNDFLKAVEPGLIPIIQHNFREKNYDYIYGAIGYLNCLLCEPINTEITFLISNLTIKEFQENSVSFKSGVYLNNELFQNENAIDLGIAHGLCAVLKILGSIQKRNPSQNCLNLIIKIISFYKEIAYCSSNKVSYFGDYYNFKSEEIYSRLGWCHGDLSIGYTIMQTSLEIGDLQAYEWAIQILLHSCKRKTLRETGVNNPYFCHGSSSVAYIYFKLYKKTHYKEFLDATIYWLNITESFLKNMDYNKIDVELLSGFLGIGFVYNSILTNDFSWDSLVMLNEL